MKKIILLALSAFVAINLMASTDVNLRIGRPIGGTNKPQHAPALLPSLCYDGTTFTLTAPYDIDDLEIVISDADGNVLYYNNVDVTAGNYIFNVPASILNDMVLVELYYGDTYLYGDL